jgi:hypothetical protein
MTKNPRENAVRWHQSRRCNLIRRYSDAIRLCVKRSTLFNWFLIIGLVLPAPAFSQGIFFGVDFGSNPPPHTPGVPDSGGLLTNDMFYAAIFLDGTQPSSGSILEKLDGGSFVPIFQFTNLVFAGYPPPATGAAFDYEGSWKLTAPQIQNLLAGKWYAQITYDSGAVYTGRFTTVPEPSVVAVLLSGLIVYLRFSRTFRR